MSGFPTLKWFPAGSGTAESRVTDFEGGRDLSSLVAYVNEKVRRLAGSHVLLAPVHALTRSLWQAGTHRDEKGGLLPSAGRLPEFDALAVEFFGAADKKAVEAKAIAAAAALPSGA